MGRTSRHARPGGSSGEPLGGAARPDPRLPWGLELGLTPRGSSCLGGSHHRGPLHLRPALVRAWNLGGWGLWGSGVGVTAVCSGVALGDWVLWGAGWEVGCQSVPAR